MKPRPNLVCVVAAPIGPIEAVKRIMVEAPDLRHLNGIYHEACAQPVVMLLSVLGLINIGKNAAPSDAAPKAPDRARPH